MIDLAGTGWLRVLEGVEGRDVTDVNYGDDTPVPDSSPSKLFWFRESPGARGCCEDRFVCSGQETRNIGRWGGIERLVPPDWEYYRSRMGMVICGNVSAFQIFPIWIRTTCCEG